MKLSIQRTVAVTITLGLLLAPSTAFAVVDSDSPDGAATFVADHTTRQKAEQELTKKLQQAKQERQTNAEDVKANLNEKLDAAKKKVCENHQTQINKLMKTMDTRRQTAYDKITAIATAVEKFVSDKSINVGDYTTLVASVDAAKAAAQTTMQSQQSAPQFDCTSDKPRADIADFKTKRSDSIDAMSAYRDAVKALVKAVKAAVPKPTSSPSPSPAGGSN